MSTDVQLTFILCVVWGFVLLALRFYMRFGLSLYAQAYLGMLVTIALISVYLKGGALAFYYQDLILLTGRDRYFSNIDPETRWMYGMVAAMFLLTSLFLGMIIWDLIGATPGLERWQFGSYTVGDHKAYTLAIWLTTAVSLLAVLFLANSIGFDVLIEDFSSKRKPLENIAIYIGIKVAFFARIAALFAMMHVFLGRGTPSTKSCMAILIILIMVSSAFVSSRSYLFGLFFEVYLLALICGRRMNSRIVLSISIGLFGLLWVSISRLGSRLEGVDDFEVYVFAHLLEGRYLLDITKIGGIGLWFIENDFANRSSGINWLLYPFMDVEIWRDTGPFIAENVFGETGHGITQGIALEMIILYSGFGVVICYAAAIATVTIINLIFAFSSKKLSRIMGNRFYPILHAILFGKFLMMYNSALGAAFFSILVDLVYLTILLLLIWMSKAIVSLLYPHRRLSLPWQRAY